MSTSQVSSYQKKSGTGRGVNLLDLRERGVILSSYWKILGIGNGLCNPLEPSQSFLALGILGMRWVICWRCSECLILKKKSKAFLIMNGVIFSSMDIRVHYNGICIKNSCDAKILNYCCYISSNESSVFILYLLPFPFWFAWFQTLVLSFKSNLNLVILDVILNYFATSTMPLQG